MGNQIVFNVLTDLISEVEKCPNAFAYLVTNGWFSAYNNERAREIHREACQVADKHGEPRPHPQLIQTVAAFHASENVYIIAGGNTASRMDFIKSGTHKMTYGEDKGKTLRTVTLALPSYLQDK